VTRGLDGVGERHSPAPQRISIQGISGSGKTTLGRLIGLQLRMPHLETDALVHGPGWTETPDDELHALVEPLVLSERWVIDSDYRRKLGTLVLQHADTVVWLDLPLRVCLRRLWNRTSHRITGHEQLWNGNTETWRDLFSVRHSLFGWAIRDHFSTRRSLPELLGQPDLAHLRLVRLRSADEVDRWAAQIKAATNDSGDDGARVRTPKRS
jgi:adenylate kinase family enzyme